MSPDLALMLTNRLVAAFPSPRWGEDTIELYAGELEGYDFEAADKAVSHIQRTHVARPSLAALRDEIGKRVPQKPALEGPAEDACLPSASFALSKREHPGQGETPGHVVRTSSEERKRLEAVYARMRATYREYVETTTPEQRRADSLRAYHEWRSRKESMRRSDAV